MLIVVVVADTHTHTHTQLLVLVLLLLLHHGCQLVNSLFLAFLLHGRWKKGSANNREISSTTAGTSAAKTTTHVRLHRLSAVGFCVHFRNLFAKLALHSLAFIAANPPQLRTSAAALAVCLVVFVVSIFTIKYDSIFGYSRIAAVFRISNVVAVLPSPSRRPLPLVGMPANCCSSAAFLCFACCCSLLAVKLP